MSRDPLNSEVSKPPRYRRSQLQLVEYGEDVDLLVSALTGRFTLVPKGVAATLARCRAFATLEEHARACSVGFLASGRAERSSAPKSLAGRFLGRMRRRPHLDQEPADPDSEQLALVQGLLAGLAEEGFLTSEQQLLEDIKACARPSLQPPPIASICLLTCRRSELLGRAVSSFTQNARAFGKSAYSLVVDDSGSPEAEDQNRQVLSAARTEAGGTVLAAGFAEREAFARLLAERADLDPALARFSLLGSGDCPISTGAARNCALLATVGDGMVFVDDDTVCRLAPVPQQQPGLVITSRKNPPEFWFYSDHRTARESVNFAEKDFLGMHESLLGRDLGACVTTHEERAPVDLQPMSSRLELALRREGGRVLATAVGTVGDSGAGSSGYFSLDPNSQRRLLQSEDAYRAAVENRQIFRSVTRTTINDSFSMAVNLGLDNRDLLPPFLPVQRNSDGIFGNILERCFPQGYYGLLPWGLLHAPAQPRRQSFDGLWRDLAGVQTAHVFDMLIRSFPGIPRGMDNATALRRLGLYLSDMGSMKLDDFEEVLRIQAWHAGSWQISQIERRIKDKERTPDFFAKYLRKYIEVVRESQPREDYIVPRDLREISTLR